MPIDVLRELYYAAVDAAKVAHLAYIRAGIWERFKLRAAWETAEFVRANRHRDYMAAIDGSMR